jgi:hypothetical protein
METAMIIPEEKWNELVAATTASINKWKARAAECQCEDRFTGYISPATIPF